MWRGSRCSARSRPRSRRTRAPTPTRPRARCRAACRRRAGRCGAPRALASSSAKPGVDLRRPLDEQAHAPKRSVPVLREAEALDVEHPLALDVETLPRRRQELDLRGALDDLAQKPGALDEVLEVVEHEQRRPLAEVVEQLLLRREAAVRAVDGELDRLGDGGREELRRGDGDERDEVHAVRVAVDRGARRPRARACVLPAPPGPTSVSRRQSGSSSSRSISSSSDARPTNDVRGAGRFFMPASIVFSSGKSHGSPSISSW